MSEAAQPHIVGLLFDTKPHETRVSVMPKHVKALVGKGVKVFVQKGAGANSGFTDDMYADAGAEMADDAKTLYDKCSLLVRFKAPQEHEVKAMRPGQTIFTYLHWDLDAPPSYGRLYESAKVTALAYEWVEQDPDVWPKFPLLYPMSVMAGIGYGVMSMRLMADYQNRVPAGYVKGRHPHAVVIGCGVMGSQCCAIFLRNNFKVIAFVHRDETLETINERIMKNANITAGELRAAEKSGEEEKDCWGDSHQPGDLVVIKVDKKKIAEVTRTANIVVNCAVRFPGEPERYLVTREMQEQMPKNTIMCDATGMTDDFVQDSVAQDELRSPTMVNGCVSYVCDHIPALFPADSSHMQAEALWPYLEEVATKGTHKALRECAPLRRSAMCIDGTVCHKYCCEKKGLMDTFKTPEEVLKM